MRFHHTDLAGAYLIQSDKHADERGFFARVFCERELSAAGLETRFTQINNAMSAQKGTLRGLHYQLPPAAEVKIVRCVHGAFWDIMVDMRPNSPTYQKWFGAELNADNRLLMYVPRGVAHGILSLTSDAEVIYLASESYAPDRERGVRWNDPAISIEWPTQPIVVSSKDSNWPDFNSKLNDVELLRGLM